MLGVLRPENLFSRCVGVMITDLVSKAGMTSVVGMAFEAVEGNFHSTMFYFESSPGSPLSPRPRSLRLLGDHANASERFRTTPSLARVEGQTYLLYSASAPYSKNDGLRSGFPESYGIFSSKNLDVLDDTELLWADTAGDALASPRLDNAGAFLRYSKRTSHSHRTDYDFCESEVRARKDYLAVLGGSERFLRKNISYATSFNYAGSEIFVGSAGKWGSEGIDLWN